MGFSLRVEGSCSPKESLDDNRSDAGETAGRTFLIERAEKQAWYKACDLQTHSCSAGGSELGSLSPQGR